MPQVFQVLKCYKCLVFQIHQTKKSNKFECKMCGEKQSIKRHYGIGTGKDCRLHVQRLNSLRGEIEETSTKNNSDNEFESSKSNEQTTEEVNNISKNTVKRSRWSDFVDKEETTEDSTNEPMFLGDKEVILEMPQKKKARKFKVKTNTTTSNLEKDVESLNDISSFKSETNWGANSIDRFEKGNNLKSFQDSRSQNSEEKIKSNERENTKHYSNPTIFKKQKLPQNEEVLHTINTNSKWAQFVENEDEGTENEINEDENDNKNITRDKLNTEHDSATKANNLFSLCDDSDLDNVLDF